MRSTFFRLLAFLLVALLSSGVTYYLTVVRAGDRVVVVANGEVGTKRELEVVNLLFRDEAIKVLATQKVIDQAASRAHVSVSPVEIKKFMGAPLPIDPELLAATTSERKTELLFRKLLVSDASEAERKAFYTSFRKELARYHVRVTQLVPGVDLPRLKLEMDAKTSFDVLSKRYGIVGKNQSKEVVLHMEDLRAVLGPSCVKLEEMTPDQILGPTPSAFGPILLQLVSIEDGYEALSSDIDEIIFRSRKKLYSFQLGIDSAISSPLAVSPGTVAEFKEPPQQQNGVVESLRKKNGIQPAVLIKPVVSPTIHPDEGLPGLIKPVVSPTTHPDEGLPKVDLKQNQPIQPGPLSSPRPAGTPSPL